MLPTHAEPIVKREAKYSNNDELTSEHELPFTDTRIAAEESATKLSHFEVLKQTFLKYKQRAWYRTRVWKDHYMTPRMAAGGHRCRKVYLYKSQLEITSIMLATFLCAVLLFFLLAPSSPPSIPPLVYVHRRSETDHSAMRFYTRRELEDSIPVIVSQKLHALHLLCAAAVDIQSPYHHIQVGLEHDGSLNLLNTVIHALGNQTVLLQLKRKEAPPIARNFSTSIDITHVDETTFRYVNRTLRDAAAYCVQNYLT